MAPPAAAQSSADGRITAIRTRATTTALGGRRAVETASGEAPSYTRRHAPAPAGLPIVP